MSNIDEEISLILLMKTFKRLMNNPLTNIGCTVGLVNKNDIYNWKCTLSGPNDSPYKGGLFKLFIKFDKSFPTVGPIVIFDTPINFWTPDTSIEDLLNSIFGLFYVANEDGAYGLDYKDEYRNRRDIYNKKAKYFTKKYSIDKMVSSKELNLTRWTFDVGDDFYQM